MSCETRAYSVHSGIEMSWRSSRSDVGTFCLPTLCLHSERICLHASHLSAGFADSPEATRQCRQDISGVGRSVGRQTLPTPPFAAYERGSRAIGVGSVGGERSLVSLWGGGIGEVRRSMPRCCTSRVGAPAYMPTLHPLLSDGRTPPNAPLRTLSQEAKACGRTRARACRERRISMARQTQAERDATFRRKEMREKLRHESGMGREL